MRTAVQVTHQGARISLYCVILLCLFWCMWYTDCLGPIWCCLFDSLGDLRNRPTLLIMKDYRSYKYFTTSAIKNYIYLMV